MNSEIAEIDYRVYFTPAQAFFTQAEFGIFLRKALLHEMLGHDGYRRYDGRLPAELGCGNNRLPRRIRGSKQSGMFIDKIHDGTVIDHLAPAPLRAVTDALDLENRGYSCTTATIAEKTNPFIKTSLAELSRARPEEHRPHLPRADHRRHRRAAGSRRSSCTCCAPTRTASRASINEDVPPRFYNDGGMIRCRYCRRPYAISHRKVTEEEKAAYAAVLPARIEAVPYPD